MVCGLNRSKFSDFLLNVTATTTLAMARTSAPEPSRFHFHVPETCYHARHTLGLTKCQCKGLTNPRRYILLNAFAK